MVSAASLDSPAKARPPARSCLLVGELLMVATKRPKCRTLSHAAPARSRCACSNSCALRHCLRGVNTAHFFTAQSEAGNADKVGELVHKVLGRILQIVGKTRSTPNSCCHDLRYVAYLLVSVNSGSHRIASSKLNGIMPYARFTRY